MEKCGLNVRTTSNWINSYTQIKKRISTWTKNHAAGFCPATFVTPQAAAHQDPHLSIGSFRQEDWSGLPVPSSGDLPEPGVEPTSPALESEFFTTE